MENTGAQNLTLRDAADASSILTIAAGDKALVSLNPDGPAWAAVAFTSASGGSVPTGVNLISGGTATSYPTITDALAASGSGDVVLVGPGTYNENITIPDNGSRVVGFPAAQQVIIAGTGTGSRVTFAGNGTLRELTVIGPASGSNHAVDATGLGAGKLAVTFNVVLRGGGASHTGALIAGSGSGILAAIGGLYHNGGTTGGPFVRLESGFTIGNQWIANAGSSSDILLATGTASADIFGLQTQSSALYSCVDEFHMESTGSVSLRAISGSLTSPAATNGLHIAANAINLTLAQASFYGSALDFLVDPALTGAGGSLVIAGSLYRSERRSIPSGYFGGLTVFVEAHADPGVENDASYRLGETSIGSVDAPAELSVGEGDSFVTDMQVWLYDASASAWTDVTTQAKDRTGSPFTMLGDAGDRLLVGHPDRFPNFNYVVTTAAVLGPATITQQLWDGSSLRDAVYLVTEANSTIGRSPLQYARSLFVRDEREHNRLSIDATLEDTSGTPQSTPYADWTSYDPGNGEDLYWVEFAVSGGSLSTAPVFERWKIGNNRFERNSTGLGEGFGGGEDVRPLLVHQRLTDDLSGASPSNGALAMTANITLTPQDNQFRNGAIDGFAWNRRVPVGSQTARKITFNAQFKVTNTNTGDIDFLFIYGVNPTGSLIDGSTTDTTITKSVTPDGTANKSYDVTFEFILPDAVPGDTLTFALLRDGTGDAYTGAVDIILIEAEGYFWR